MTPLMDPTSEQRAVMEHNPTCHGRVLAGPGTGKSTASVGLYKELMRMHPDLQVRMLTFTRAATAELAKKVGNADPDIRPSTIHAFALSLLMRNPSTSNLPTPIRIPDSWETRELIHPHLARRLRIQGFEHATVVKVKRLERELASRWQSLDDRVPLLANVDPPLRSAYVGLWEHHRHVFGYTLLVELPFQAGKALEDFDPRLDPVDLLIVDEYQDLNEADIKLIRLLAQKKGIHVLAIGDDDQSIYGFRLAAPPGIRRFPEEFGNCRDYALTISQRCGKNILAAATSLIEAAPDRPRKMSLTPRVGMHDGQYLYLRFTNGTKEVKGVVDLIQTRIQMGVPPSEIAVLVRGQADRWAGQLIPALKAYGIAALNVDWVESVLQEPEVRKGLALLRLALQLEDSLAWWTLLLTQRGISEGFVDYIYQSVGSNESFGHALLRLHPYFAGAPTEASAKAAASLITETTTLIKDIQIEGATLEECGWGGWVLQHLNKDRVSDKAVQMFEEVGRVVPQATGLSYFLGQLEPIGKDLASQSDGVRIMSMTSSKGLTVNTCIIMGAEKNIIPDYRADLEEERRLLYVGMTRATDMCVLTFASRRQGPTARQGTASVNRPRGRCPLLENLPKIGDYRDGEQVIAELQRAV